MFSAPPPKAMNYSAHYQHHEYDLSSRSRESYHQSTNNLHSYPNPQFSGSINPFSYENPIVQPLQHEEQEPNPPGVTPPPQPPLPELSRNSYFQYHAHGAAAGFPTVGTQPGVVVRPPIVQPLYMGGIVPRGDARIHFGPKLNVSSYPFPVGGRGGGNALPMNAAIPFQDQTFMAHGGFHIQGGPSQLPSQSFGEIHHVPRPKFSGRTYSVRGRGRGKGRQRQKHAAAPALDLQCKPDILGGGSQPMADSSASSSGQKLVLLQGPAQSSSILPHTKAVSCELCKIECNTIEILQQHMNGKKHKKKLKVMEELENLNKKVICGQREETLTIELKSDEVLSQPDAAEVLPCEEMKEESKVAGGKRKVEEVEAPQESAKKKRVGPSKRKQKKSGKSNRKMRACDPSKSLVQPPNIAKEVAAVALVCELCNVKCESVVVFQSHLAGKKHKSKAKRFLGQGHELLQSQKAAVDVGDASSLRSEHADVACRGSVDGGSALGEDAVS